MEIISIPNLDKILYPDGKIPAHVKLERRIVKGMVEHLEKSGFKLSAVDDGEEFNRLTDLAPAMEHIFNVDESRVIFWKPGTPGQIWVFLVHGNGIDLISDYGGPKEIYEEFDKAMKTFNPEQFE